MPTYQSDVVRERDHAYRPTVGGQVFTRRATFQPSVAIADDDVIEMIPVFEGEQVVNMTVLTTNKLVDDGSFDVGDGDDVDRYIDGNSALAEGGRCVYGNGPPNTAATAAALDHRYAGDDTIDINCGVVTSARTGAGQASVTMIAQLVYP